MIPTINRLRLENELKEWLRKKNPDRKEQFNTVSLNGLSKETFYWANKNGYIDIINMRTSFNIIISNKALELMK